MKHFLLVLAIFLAIVGLLGSDLPVLLALPLPFCGFLLFKLTNLFSL
jgi:hypothetical protein